MAWLGLLLIVLQWGLSVWSFLTHQGPLFNFVFTEMSPVVLFFSLLDFVHLSIGMRVTNFLLFSLIWNAMKYTCYLAAYSNHSESKPMIAAVILEALYIAAVTYSLFYYAEL